MVGNYPHLVAGRQHCSDQYESQVRLCNQLHSLALDYVVYFEEDISIQIHVATIRDVSLCSEEKKYSRQRQ